MRRIIIPQKALKRHEETFGKTLLGYLKWLAAGKTLTWPTCGKVKNGSYKANKACEKFYWKWILRQFSMGNILTATPLKLIQFEHENVGHLLMLRLFKNAQLELMDSASRALFNYEEFRSGKILLPCGTKGHIQWIDKPIKPPVRKSRIYEQHNLLWGKWGDWFFSEFVRLLGIRYCPYCNAETVGLVERDNSKMAYSALDHILPKSKHPLLALSLYNLVPACTKCNSQLKHESDEFDVGNWDPRKPFNALHPYAHNIHKWFRFVYRPSSVDELFLDPRKSRESPLSIDPRIPLPADKQKPFDYDGRTKQYTTQYELPGSYYDLYAAEINEMIRMEMICTPTFEKAMREKGLSDEDFNIAFRRTSLDPREINKHRFAKLIIDLNQQIGRKDPQNLKETGHA